ncbi:DUF2239 family protein [Sphingosinicella rhizophila]|uniref:DUF2239 family protein n=1 Tax=Sphingosinicella rhizophila TaxID=3050082 RepID=A0ABU3Q570_9SPHN|nr:DUF2239 family protein [Sphingosinicella sp. GR2756]MDT9598563.1 DUF2239 family protein [Sphingosinicella sp. GR2756]
MDTTVTAFLEGKQIASGDRETVTQIIETRYPASDHAAIRVFDDGSGRVVDLDYWDVGPAPARGRGRPKLGVTAREVTLLPRHWDWLSAQPGGASAALRRLVEEARRTMSGPSERERRDAAYHFMHAMCGDRPGYEEALRALYRGDAQGFEMLTETWPGDVRFYIGRLLGSVQMSAPEPAV